MYAKWFPHNKRIKLHIDILWLAPDTNIKYHTQWSAYWTWIRAWIRWKELNSLNWIHKRILWISEKWRNNTIDIYIPPSGFGYHLWLLCLLLLLLLLCRTRCWSCVAFLPAILILIVQYGFAAERERKTVHLLNLIRFTALIKFLIWFNQWDICEIHCARRLLFHICSLTYTTHSPPFLSHLAFFVFWNIVFIR